MVVIVSMLFQWSAEHVDMLTCCKLSNNGRLACVGSDLFRELNIYDLVSGELINKIKGTCLHISVRKLNAICGWGMILYLLL